MIITKVTHTADCTRVFKRYDLSCPRCQELAHGAPARKGWFTPRALEPRWVPCRCFDPNPGGYCTVCGNGRDVS